ncbi:MAG TPA: hypothetical protein VL966_09365 [Alphaproteobacteria bacterium]|jgi:hypothetical protein|nr:hypothetical protein [Alphaproteobacteria bacterium]
MEDQELLSSLRAAIDRGDVETSLDIKRQHHVDSPLYRESDSSPFLYVCMLAIGAVGWFYGWQAGIGAFVVAALLYMVGVRRFVAVRMRRRFTNEVLVDPEKFRKAWKLKGLAFRHKASGIVCESPDGLWRSFVIERCR